MSESDVLIVGDGPAGLSAGLFLAKNDLDVEVFGTDGTPMHKAMLYNYLGIPEMTGSEFQQIGRDQVTNFGGTLHDTEVERVEKNDRFRVETTEGDTFEADYLVIATSDRKMLEQLGVEIEDGVAKVDRNGYTNVDGVFAVGWATRKQKIQAIISAGEGAAAALSILSEEAGEDFHDFDTV